MERLGLSHSLRKQWGGDGILPSKSILSAIADFPPPTDLKSARRWFGLVNQVSWAHATHPLMQPFRDLIKPHTKFYWDETLEKLFHESKQLLLNKVKDGVKSFELGRITCVQTDWCKEGIGYLLLQKHCDCSDATNIRCCPDGWHLIFAGSRFTKPAESRYSATEGEALAVAWSLAHSKMFTLGCKNLVVSVDHKPLLGILNDRHLGGIDNPRLQDLKEHTLKWDFAIVHNPGKSHAGADAVSRHPSMHAVSLTESPLSGFLASIRGNPEDTADNYCTNVLTLSDPEQPAIAYSIEEQIQRVGIVCASKIAVTINDVRLSGRTDPVYQLLISTYSVCVFIADYITTIRLI